MNAEKALTFLPVKLRKVNVTNVACFVIPGDAVDDIRPRLFFYLELPPRSPKDNPGKDEAAQNTHVADARQFAYCRWQVVIAGPAPDLGFDASRLKQRQGAHHSFHGRASEGQVGVDDE